MVELDKMWIITKTAGVQGAGTNADLQVEVTTNYRQAIFRFMGLGPDALGEGRLFELECDIKEYQIYHRDVSPHRMHGEARR